MSENEIQNQRKRRCGCGGWDFKEAKLVILVPYKATKLLIPCGKVSNKRNSNPNSSSEISGKRKFVYSCFCFKQGSTLESSSPVESVTSDPNDAKFTFEMLRSLIENNDFYSKECNPHLDPSCSSIPTDDSCAK